MKQATSGAQAGTPAAPNELTGAAAWRLIAITVVIGCLVMMALYSAIVLIPAIAAEFGVGANGAALAVTAFALVYAGALPLFGSHLLWAIGCNDVTRHDAVLSVEAGFSGCELSALWPESNEWQLHEHAARLFTHCFVARRVHESAQHAI